MARPIETSGRLRLVPALFATLLAACAVAPTAPATAPPAPVPFVGADLRVRTAGGPMVLRVMETSPGTSDTEPDAQMREDALRGVLLTPLGLVMGPMFGGAVILGGVFVATLGGGMYANQSRNVGDLRRTLATIELGRLLDDALRRHALPPDDPTPAAGHGEVLLTAWGIGAASGRADSPHCFVVEVGLVIERDGVRGPPVPFRILAGTDPPAQCADVATFVADGGWLARDTARDYAELLAALIVRRLGGAP